MWQAITNIHANVKLSAPEELWYYALAYFHYCEENPIYESQLVKYPLRTELVAVPKMRAMSLTMLLNHAGISADEYQRVKALPEFAQVCKVIEDIIFDQKFTGAASGMLKEAMISRDLGLAEKVDHTSSDGSMSPSAIDKELVENLARKLTGG